MTTRTASTNAPVLITGFGPFPGVPLNVSGVLAEALGDAARTTFPTARFEVAVLPTEWVAAPQRLEELMMRHRPAVALHFGVSHQARGFVVETQARNAACHVDASGEAPLTDALFPNQPEAHAATLPAARIVQRLRRAGLPAALSQDAGAYLCNAILFHSLRLNSRFEAPAASGFIHIPTRLPQRSTILSFDDALRGGLEIVATALRRPPAARPLAAATASAAPGGTLTSAR